MAEKQEGFVPWVLRKLNNNLDLPTNAKVYIESVIEGNRDPITGDAFTKEERAIIRDLIAAAGREEGFFNTPASKSVNYQTYGKDLPNADTTFGMRTTLQADEGILSLLTPEGRVATTLGRFDYKLNEDGDVEVVDTYNFNKFRTKKEEIERSLEIDNPILKPIVETMSDVLSGGYGSLIRRGREKMGDKNSEGRPVNITIPKEDFTEEDYNRIYKEEVENFNKGGKVKMPANYSKGNWNLI
jgi:hypothetical protein